MTKYFVIVNNDEPDFRFRELGFTTKKDSAEKLLKAYKELYKFDHLSIEEIDYLKIKDKITED